MLTEVLVSFFPSTLTAQEKYKNDEKNESVGSKKRAMKIQFRDIQMWYSLWAVVVLAAAATKRHLSEREIKRIVFGVLTKSFKYVKRMQP